MGNETKLVRVWYGGKSLSHPSPAIERINFSVFLVLCRAFPPCCCLLPRPSISLIILHSCTVFNWETLGWQSARPEAGEEQVWAWHHIVHCPAPTALLCLPWESTTTTTNSLKNFIRDRAGNESCVNSHTRTHFGTHSHALAHSAAYFLTF